MSCVSCTYSLIPPSISFLPPLALDVGPQTSAMDSKVGGSTGIDWAALDKAAAAEKKKLAKVSLVVLDGWILFGLCQLLSFFFFGLIFLYWFHSLSSSSRQLGASVSHHRILTWRVLTVILASTSVVLCVPCPRVLVDAILLFNPCADRPSLPPQYYRESLYIALFKFGVWLCVPAGLTSKTRR